MSTLQHTLVRQMLALMPAEGMRSADELLIPRCTRLQPASGITLMRSHRPTARQAVLYQSVLYIVLQGQKRSYLGQEEYQYDALNFLATSVPLPMEGHVSQASAEAPYLAIRIDITAPMVHAMLGDLPVRAPDNSRGVCICPMSPAMTEVLSRLLAALADADASRLLVPLMVQEALFHALRGPQGPQLAAFVTQGRQHQRIARVIHHIQGHYQEPLEIEALAHMANMSPSTLHQHFKAVTNASPLQYIKALRLHQAHALVTQAGHSVSEAAYQVGYQSLSQFSREYKRLFGAAPSQHRAD